MAQTVSSSPTVGYNWLGRKRSLGRKGTKLDPPLTSPQDNFIPYRGQLSFPPPEPPTLLPSSSSSHQQQQQPQAGPSSYSYSQRRATIGSGHSTSPRSRPQAQFASPPTQSRLFPTSGGIGESPISPQLQQQLQQQQQSGKRIGGGSGTSSAGDSSFFSTLERQGPSSASLNRVRSNSTSASITKPISDPLRAPSPVYNYNPTRPPPPQPKGRRHKHLHPGFSSSSSPDLRNLACHPSTQTYNEKQPKNRQLVYEATTMCDAFVYPQPKLRPFLITPPNSPPIAQLGRDPSPEFPAASSMRELLNRFPSSRRSQTYSAVRPINNRRPSLPADFVTSDESSDVRVLREGDQRELEKIAWAKATQRGSLSRAASQLSVKGRKRSGSTGRGELEASMGSQGRSSGNKLSFDFLAKPTVDERMGGGRTSASPEGKGKPTAPRKSSSQGDLRARQASLMGQGGQESRVPVEHAPQPFYGSGNHHPFLGRPFPTSCSVIDIGPDGIWNELDREASPSAGAGGPDEGGEPALSRFVVGEAISSETADSSASSSRGSYERTHRRYASQASRSISSLEAFHARFPHSPHAIGSFQKSHGRANTISSSSARLVAVDTESSQENRSVSPFLGSTPLYLEQQNRSWIKEAPDSTRSSISNDPSRSGSASDVRKVASASSLRVHPSTSGKVVGDNWTFPPSPDATASAGSLPEIPRQSSSSRQRSFILRKPVASSSNGAEVHSSVGSAYSNTTTRAPLFSYDNYETLFYEPPSSPRIHAPPSSSDGGEETWSETGFGEDVFPESRPPILRHVSHSLSIPSSDHSTQHRYSGASVRSEAGELGDLSLSASAFPHPPTGGAPGPGPSGSTASFSQSFVTADSHLTISSPQL